MNHVLRLARQFARFAIAAMTPAFIVARRREKQLQRRDEVRSAARQRL